ncbi:MAG TPA: hypothetical protein VFV99_12515 [Kofleriaceae bacterium]|nr:hypothetical protein [Kofleriaceae bacterium]
MADDSHVASVAGNCQPDHNASDIGTYNVVNGVITVSSPSIFYCSVPLAKIGTIYALRLTASGNAHEVSAKLIRWSKGDGSTWEMGTISSSGSGVQGILQGISPETYDPTTYNYYFQVTISDSAGVFYGLEMIGTATDTAPHAYQTVASACQPEPNTIDSGRYLVSSGGTVTFKGSATGTIKMYCQIPTKAPMFPWSQFRVYYKNNSSTSYIKASLIKMNRSGGTRTALATVNSQSGTNDNAFRSVSTPTPSEDMDMNVYYYYIVLEISRTSSTQTPKAYALTIDN